MSDDTENLLKCGERSEDRLFRSVNSRGGESFASALSGNERVPIEAFRSTRARWYILFTFCYMGLIQAFIGNSWGPIVEVMKKIYQWSDQRVSSLALWTPVFFVPSAMFFPFFMAMTNMRTVMLSNTTLLATSGLIKILSVTVIPMKYLIYSAHVTQIMNGLCGAVPFSAIMYISVNWFPVKEQLVVVGLIVACQSAGVAVPFVLGPTIVPEPTNTTLSAVVDNMTDKTLIDNHDVAFYDAKLKWYLMIQGTCMIASWVFALIYFPSRPSVAPAASAVVYKLDVIEGMKILLQRPRFWIPVIAFSLTTGAINGYGLTLEQILENSKLNAETAEFIGFAALLCSVPANLIVGTLGAIFPRHRKIMAASFLITGTAAMAVFVAELEFWIPRNMVIVWASVIVGVLCLTGCAPLLFDMSAESSHPVSEELSSTVMVLGNQISCLLYIALIQIFPTSDKDELNYVLLAAFTTAIITLLFYRTTDIRSSISVTVDQLDYRSIQQIENAGFSVDYLSANHERTSSQTPAFFDADYADDVITPSGT